jgi:signal transduction histidine kinase
VIALLVEQNVKIASINEDLAKAKTRAEENDNLKTAFLANMSHEIRTPMNAIIGFCEMLEVDTDAHLKQTYTDIISKSAHRLLHLLNDIIDISKIETGQIELSLKPTNLRQVIDELKQRYELLVTSKGVVFVFRPDKGQEALWLNTDEHRVNQVLNNLLSNALKHTATGKIEMAYELQGDRVKFWVKDTGNGIDSDDLKHIFERFYQGRENRMGGTGLGLAITKSIVERLGGEIGVESSPGNGSMFWFTHPLNG